jgi:hypothetical protein
MKRYKRLLTVAMVLVAVSLVSLTIPAMAQPNPPQPPSGGTLVVNVIATITNDEDSGYQGYWAIDNYSLHTQIWEYPNGSFYVVLTAEGKSTTYAGIPAPGISGTEGGTGTATMHGFVVFWITGGTLNPSPTVNGKTVGTKGYVGPFNYGGSKAYLGPYSTAISPPNTVNWPAVYVSGGSEVGGSFYYFYVYQSQTWVDASSVSAAESGNIIVS